LKSGKSTLASTFPKPLFLSTEKGLNALPGVYSQPITSWAEFKTAVTELQKDEVRATFSTIVIDTLTNLIESLDLYIGAQLSTDKETYKFGTDVPYGKGAARLGKELNEQLQKLAKKGYTIVSIAHSEEKTNFKTKETMLSTSLDKKPGLVIDRFVDNILFLDNIEMKDGSLERRLYFRGTDTFKAGSRYKYVPQYCIATYETLRDTVLEAIEKQEKETPATIAASAPRRVESATDFEETEYDFTALMLEFKEITANLIEQDEDNAEKIANLIEKELGPGKKVSQLKKNQAELLYVVVQTLKTEFGI